MSMSVRSSAPEASAFSVIMAALGQLAPGQGLRLYATFKPVPLFAVMADKGFAHSERELDGGEWEVLFEPVTAPAASPPQAQAFDEWPEPKTKLDNRDLDPPEPMVRILAAAEKLAPGETLSALLRRGPSSYFAIGEAGLPMARRLHARRHDLRTDRAGAGMSDDLAARIRDALRVVVDPELSHNIVDLGFVYAIAVEDGVVRITMTATTPGCPAASFLEEGVANSASRVPGVRSVDVGDDVRPAVETLNDRARCPGVARVRAGALER